MLKKGLFASCLVALTAHAESASGIQWTPPTSWKADAPRPMRVVTYRVPSAKGDADEAECGVFYFGSGQGGSVDANVSRWIGQFEQPDGKTSQDVAKIRKDKVKTFTVTWVEVSGTYAGMSGPFAPVPVKKPDYALVGAIVEAPEGAVFFKLTGPKKTVAAAQRDLQKMLTSVR